MSVADNWDTMQTTGNPLPMPSTTERRPWHRIAEVRRQQGISVRSITRKMGLSAEEIRQQEDPTSDLTLSQLCAWQKALEVPLASLLIDMDAPLSGPVLTRARMLRIMKTAQAIKEGAKDAGTQRMGLMLVEQLLEVMPELKDVSAWHTVGQRRTQDEVGRIAERPISDTFIQDALR
jgi:transcriptional regulator with XRE-family HTH domain